MTSGTRSALLVTFALSAGFSSAALAHYVASTAGEQSAIDAGVPIQPPDPPSLDRPAGAVTVSPPPAEETPPEASGSAGAAAAEPPGFPLPSLEIPEDTLADLISFARSGKGRLAIGAAIVLLVWLLRKHILHRIAWFQTQRGGYVASFGTTLLLYVSGGLGAGVFSVDLIADALATGFTAGHQHELVGDLAAAAKRRAVSAAQVLLVLLTTIGTAGLVVVTLATAGSCGAWQKSGAGQALIDCTVQNQVRVEAVGAELKPLVTSGDWGGFYDRAKDAGIAIGGCAAAQVVQEFLSGRRATPETWKARDTFERFRAELAGGATYRTAQGDL